MDKWLVKSRPYAERLVIFDDCASQLGRRWLFLGFLRFLALALLSFSHNRSPHSIDTLKDAATNVMRLKMRPCRRINHNSETTFGKTQRKQMINRHEKM